MDFREIFRVLWRRWPISVTALLLTVVATAATYAKWPATYQSNASITLISSKVLTNQPDNGNNPYLGVGSLSPMASILASSLSSSQTGQQLRALGVKDSFSAEVPAYAAGPFLTISLTGTNPRTIERSMPIVIDFAQHRLKSLQETGLVRTPEDALIRSVVIAAPSAPDEIKKQKIQAVAFVAIIGLLMVFLLSFSAEAIAQRRASSSRPQLDEKAITGDGIRRADSEDHIRQHNGSLMGQDRGTRKTHEPTV